MKNKIKLLTFIRIGIMQQQFNTMLNLQLLIAFSCQLNRVTKTTSFKQKPFA